MTRSQTQQSTQALGNSRRTEGTNGAGRYTDRIEGSYRSLTVHQLTLAWWLHASGHMTRRQLRVWFALHELSERRRYAKADRKPQYTIQEILQLVGGRGHESKARSDIARDLGRLRELGLADFSLHAIALASSADAIRLDSLDGFWAMFEQMPNRRRSIPVPRRMIRALAAGLTRASTALVIAMMIRGLFWHKQSDRYRVDGRYKLSWVAQHFGVSRRSLSEARASLIDLGWLEPLGVTQWQMNRWGLHDMIVTDWKPPPVAEEGADEVPNSTDCGSAESATPNPGFSSQSASPDQTDSLSQEGDQENRTLPERERSGVSPGSTRKERQGGRKKKIGRTGSGPNIRDVHHADLRDTDRLLELHRQAAELGLIDQSEAGRLAFFSLAERARTRGRRAGALFYWLLRERKHAFITHHDEDEAARRLREHYNGPRQRQASGEQWGGSADTGAPTRPSPQELTEGERFVAACLRVAQQKRIEDPFSVARQVKPWTREEWDTAHQAFVQAQYERWNPLGATS